MPSPASLLIGRGTARRRSAAGARCASDVGVRRAGYLIRREIGIAREFDITVYDAAFVTVAEMLDTTLVTADEKMARRLASLAYVVYLAEAIG